MLRTFSLKLFFFTRFRTYLSFVKFRTFKKGGLVKIRFCVSLLLIKIVTLNDLKTIEINYYALESFAGENSMNITTEKETNKKPFLTIFHEI